MKPWSIQKPVATSARPASQRADCWVIGSRSRFSFCACGHLSRARSVGDYSLLPTGDFDHIRFGSPHPMPYDGRTSNNVSSATETADSFSVEVQMRSLSLAAALLAGLVFSCSLHAAETGAAWVDAAWAKAM